MSHKLAFGGLGFLFLASTFVATPAMATTDPIAELRIRIAELQEQLAKLMVQSNYNIGHGAQGEPDHCHMPFAHNLMIGSTDAKTSGEVTKLQQFLQSQGYTEAQITGYYGNVTAGLVMRWQKAHGMDFVTLKSGVGPMTRAKINANCGVFSPGSENSESDTMDTYHEIRENCFEGCERMSFEFRYPKNIFSVAKGSNPDIRGIIPNLVIKEIATGKTHNVLYAYEGGRGYSLQEWWEYNLKPLCPTCTLVANRINISSASGVLTYANSETEVILFGRLGFTFAVVIQQPAQKIEDVVSSFVLMPPAKITIDSPMAGENWKIGETRTITLSKSADIAWPEGLGGAVDLVREDGTVIGIIFSTKLSGPLKPEVQWNTANKLYACLGAGCTGSEITVTPGRYKIRIVQDGTILADGGVFTLSY